MNQTWAKPLTAQQKLHFTVSRLFCRLAERDTLAPRNLLADPLQTLLPFARMLLRLLEPFILRYTTWQTRIK